MCRFFYFLCGIIIYCNASYSQGVKYNHNLSPAEGLIKPQENPYRQEICLNGSWEFQPVALPSNWVTGTGIPPNLIQPVINKWEKTKIKIPSPWNVNEWGGGSNVGKGTNSPYAPSSVYFPSYPVNWSKVRMGWLRRNFNVPKTWIGKRLILHFEAVAGDCIVLINGKQVSSHFDAYLPFDVDITNFVKKSDTNELLVGIRHRNLFNKNKRSI